MSYIRPPKVVGSSVRATLCMLCNPMVYPCSPLLRTLANSPSLLCLGSPRNSCAAGRRSFMFIEILSFHAAMRLGPRSGCSTRTPHVHAMIDRLTRLRSEGCPCPPRSQTAWPPTDTASSPAVPDLGSVVSERPTS